MVLDKRWQGITTFRAQLSMPLYALHYLVDLPTQVGKSTKRIVRSRHHLSKANKKLKKQLLITQAKLQRINAIENENQYLKSLLQSAQKIKGKTLIADLLSVNSEPFINQLILNKGKKDGVYEGQPVLDAKGVIGQITEIGPISSRVLLINDTHSGIAVQNTRNGLRATATGDQYSGKIRLMYLPNTADVQIGDLFVTSGLGGRYPEGYLVGHVLSIVKDPTKQFANVLIQPSANLDSSRQVLLVWWDANNKTLDG